MDIYLVGQKVVAAVVIAEEDEFGAREVYARPGDEGTVVHIDLQEGFPTVEFRAGVTICAPEELRAAFLN